MPAAKPHAVLITTGSAGDLFPFLKLGLGLRQRGHAVTVVTLAQHEPYVRQAGLDFHGVPGDPAALEDPDLWHPTRGFGVVWRHTRPGMAAARAFVASLPANEQVGLVVHPLAVPEADLCRAVRPGMAIVSVWLAPSNLRTIYDPMTLGPLTVPRWVPAFARRWLWRAAGAQINAVALAGVNAARSEQGMTPVRSMIDHLFGVADLSVMLFPDWFAASQPDWPPPLRMADFPLFDPAAAVTPVLAPALAAFLAAGPAPLVVTHGTGNVQAAAFFANALEAARRLGQRVILLTPQRSQVPATLPEWAFWQDYCAFGQLLPHVAALVHHGGIGTTAEALRAGTPQLIVALAYDQFDNGARVAALDAGRTMRASHCSPTHLTTQLRALLESASVRASCATVKARFGNASAFDSALDAVSARLSE